MPHRPAWVSITVASLFVAGLAGCSDPGAPRAATPDGGGPTPAERFAGPDWYKQVVLYEIWVRSFNDSDGDGDGDLRGIIERLDHVAALGVGAIWLTPFYPTPYFDSGYDIADYRAVDPRYGTLADWDELLAAAHARGIRVLNDLVLNHTSIEHEWFERSRERKDSPLRDYYVWAAEPPFGCEPIDAPVFGESRWELDPRTGERYFHQFYAQQPDLNYDNPAVADAMLDNARFWLERGVDGFRVDAISTLVEGPTDDAPDGPVLCSDHPRTHAFLKRLRALLDEYPSRTSVAEAWGTPAEDAAYFGGGADEFHMSMSLTLAIGMQGAVLLDVPAVLVANLQRAWSGLPPGAQLANWLSSHDRPRVMTNAQHDPRRAAVAAALLLTLPGTPILYYGDEVGMRDGTGVVVDGRDGARTPMAWTGGAGAGFTTGTPWLPCSAGGEVANVAAQEGAAGSLLELHRRLIGLRNRLGIFGDGELVLLDTAAQSSKLLAYVRRQGDTAALVLLSFADRPQAVSLDLSPWVAVEAQLELGSFDGIPALAPARARPYALTLPPYGFVIWTLPASASGS